MNFRKLPQTSANFKGNLTQEKSEINRRAFLKYSGAAALTAAGTAKGLDVNGDGINDAIVRCPVCGWEANWNFNPNNGGYWGQDLLTPHTCPGPQSSASDEISLELQDRLDLGIDLLGVRQEMIQEITANGVVWRYGGPSLLPSGSVVNEPSHPDANMTLPHDAAEGDNSPPNYYTIYGKVTPASEAANATVTQLTGLTIARIDKQDALEDGRIPIRVTALRESDGIVLGGIRMPDEHECVINLVAGGKHKTCSIYVLRPKFIKDQIAGTEIFAGTIPKCNIELHASYEAMRVWEELPPGAHSKFVDGYEYVHNVEVLDQFRSPLPIFYDGTAVQEQGDWINWISSHAYEDPLGYWNADGNNGINFTPAVPPGYIVNLHIPNAMAIQVLAVALPWNKDEGEIEVNIAGHSLDEPIHRTRRYTAIEGVSGNVPGSVYLTLKWAE